MKSTTSILALMAALMGIQAWGWVEVSRVLDRRSARFANEPVKVLAQSEKSGRKSASKPDRSLASLHPQGQGERMLHDPASRYPGFIPRAPQKPSVGWGAACRDSHGAVSVSWQDPNGYSRCLEDRSITSARAAGVVIAAP
jgi:hypothetical protein